MSEKMPQAEVDRAFDALVATTELSDSDFRELVESMDSPDDVAENTITLSEFYRHLVAQGYTDEEIITVFDLKVTEVERGDDEV